MSGNKLNHIGIDVGAKMLVVEMKLGIDGSIHQGEFENTRSGHTKLHKWMTKSGANAKVCLEATGVYHFQLAVMLTESKNIAVMIVNPCAMKHFSTALMQRAKTDKADAHVVLEYALRMEFISWEKPSDITLEIQALTRRLHQIKQSIIAEKNRLAAADYRGESGKVIMKSIKAHIKQLEKHIENLQAQLMGLIKQADGYKEEHELVTSITGFAEVSASQLLSELMTLPDNLTPAQYVAFAGLDPKPRESGTSLNKPRKTSKHGNKFLRSSLFMPALVAIQHDPNVKAFYDKLIAKGKMKMQAIVAVMRKLLNCICGMLKSKTKWDGNKFFKVEAQA